MVTDAINTKSTRSLLWIVGLITFFMSAVLDNLTSTIVMVSLLRKLIKDPMQRQFFGATPPPTRAQNSGSSKVLMLYAGVETFLMLPKPSRSTTLGDCLWFGYFLPLVAEVGASQYQTTRWIKCGLDT